jgi:hypothetical protein
MFFLSASTAVLLLTTAQVSAQVWVALGLEGLAVAGEVLVLASGSRSVLSAVLLASDAERIRLACD